MRTLLAATAAITLAGCTFSLPAPPDQRAALPTCQAGEVALSGTSGFSCAPQSALLVDQVPYAGSADSADAVRSANEATRAGHALTATGASKDAQILLGPPGDSPSGPGIWVRGGAFVNTLPVPFVLGSFDSVVDAGSPTVSTQVGSPASIVFPQAVQVALPPREPAPNVSRASDVYQVLVRASGVVRGTARFSAGGITRCKIDVTIAYPTSSSTTGFVNDTVPVLLAGDDVLGGGTVLPGEFTWSYSQTVYAHAGLVTVGLQLELDQSNAVSPKCSTGNENGESTHVQLEAY